MISDLEQAEGLTERERKYWAEGFTGYYVSPLTFKGELIGALEVLKRTPLHPDNDWSKYMDQIAFQTAIAIENSTLADRLQRSNLELTLAYETTLEGWASALELRDLETEGHCQRVAELSVHLASALGINPSALIHLRRGALLHDIGKIGIPDNILLKAGPLTDEEWKIMKSHPTHAYNMLLPIAYLRPAIDIPYYHHEKWDGSGYPQGWSGEQIPLAARIFAVVDVWDALLSDRPYRKAWTRKKALAYIQEQSGKHFDPRVVNAFLELIKDKP